MILLLELELNLVFSLNESINFITTKLYILCNKKNSQDKSIIAEISLLECFKKELSADLEVQLMQLYNYHDGV